MWILVCVMLVRVSVCAIQMSDVGVCNAGVCVCGFGIRNAAVCRTARPAHPLCTAAGRWCWCVCWCVLVCASTDRVELQFVVQLDQLVHCVLLQDDDVGVWCWCVCWCVWVLTVWSCSLSYSSTSSSIVYCCRTMMLVYDVGVWCWCVCWCVLVCASTDRVELQFVVQLDQLVHSVLLQDDDAVQTRTHLQRAVLAVDDELLVPLHHKQDVEHLNLNTNTNTELNTSTWQQTQS